MSAGPSGPPQDGPQECRRRAEDHLDGAEADVPRAIAFGLLAVAGELHEIRRLLNRRR